MTDFVCPTLSNINNGQLRLAGLAVDSIATYSCNPGYKFSKKDTTGKLICVQSQTAVILKWNGSVPQSRW